MTELIPSRSWSVVFIAVALWAGSAQGTPVRLVTFGPEASPGKGDDDFTEEIYLRIPPGAPSPLYVRIFDPDIGGAEDEPNGLWNTRTRFAVYGGEGAGRRSTPDAGTRGSLLAEAMFGEDAAADGRWTTLAEIDPHQGDPIAGGYLFRLRVEGIAGDDGNLYDLALSADPNAVRPVAGVEVLNERPTISIPPAPGRVAEARFQVPAGTRALSVHGFDLDRARAAMEMPFVDPKPLSSSGDGRWSRDRVQMPAGATPGAAAVVIRGGRALLNDVVLEVRDQDDRPLAFELPIRMVAPSVPPEPRIRYTFDGDCRSVAFDASASDGVDDALIDFAWRFGDGAAGAGKEVRHSYREPGTYEVSLTVTDDSGRVVDRARTEVGVKINRLPEPVPGPPLTLAPGERVHLDGSASRDSDGRIIGYRWDFGDGDSARGPRVSHAYAEPGRYALALSVEDDGPGPCTTAEASTRVWANASPLAEAGPDRVAAVGEPVHLDAGASQDPDGQIESYQWDFGDGASERGARVKHSYRRPGRYAAVLTVADDAGVANSRTTDRLNVSVNDPPLAQLAAPQRGAVAEPLTFDASASRDPDGELTQYLWDFGDGSHGSGVEASHRFASPGTYVVRLTVHDDSGTRSGASEATRTVVINDPPVAEAGPDQWVTASEVAFDGTGSRDPDGRIRSWHWDFGDGATGSGPTPVHVYAAPGTYEVGLRVTDDSQTRSATRQDSLQVRVNAKPAADAGPDRLGVPGTAIDFDGAGSFDPDGRVLEYLWDFGDGETASGHAVTHSYRRPGRYHVGLEVRDDSGHAAAVGTADALVRINAAPVALAGPDRRVAPGEPVRLDATASYDPDGEIHDYTWTIGEDSQVATGPVQEIGFDTPGVVTAVLEVVDDSGAPNGLAQDALSVHVNHPPGAVLAERIEGCDLRVPLDGGGSWDPDGDRLRYSWDFGDGSPPSRGERLVHRFPEGGRYPVTLNVDDGTGLANATDSAVTEVWIHRPPTAAAEAPSLVCAGDVVLFNGTRSSDPDEGQLLYEWDFGDGSSAPGVSPVKRYRQAGHYAVTLRVQDDSALPCDHGLDRIGVTVVDAPVAVAGDDRRVCAGQPITFDGTASRDFDDVVNGYQWDFGDGSHGGGAEPTHVYERAGDYRVKLTVTGDQIGDCDNRNTDELRVEVLEAPRVEIQAPAAAAPGHDVAFSAVAPGDGTDPLPGDLEARWDFGDGQQGEGAEVSHRYATPGRYQVMLRVDDGRGDACSETQRLHSILVNAPPEAVAGADTQVAAGEPLVFDASASADPDGVIRSHRWDFGDGTQGEGVRVRHRYSEPGLYSATLTVTDDSGLANASQRDRLSVRVNAAPVPVIAASPEVPCPGEEVRLDASESLDPDGTLTRWVWDFGDEAQSEGVRTAHSFAKPGRYRLRLELSDDSGSSNARVGRERELSVNAEPIAAIREPLRGCPQRPIRFDATRSRDPDGQIIDYVWTFWDGNEDTGAIAAHGYAEAGRYPVELRVTDDSGSACAQARAVSEALVNARPAARIRASSTVAYLDGAHEALQFDATGSEDPDGDPLVYHWDFGDQAQARGPAVVHRFTEAGRYDVVLTARDDSGTVCSEATASLQIEVKATRNANTVDRRASRAPPLVHP